MAFPETSVLDTFTRANNTDLGTDWTPFNGWNRGSVNNNQLFFDLGGSSGEYWSAAQFGPSCEVFWTVADAPSYARIHLSVQSPGTAAQRDGYYFDGASSTEGRIWREDNGTATQLGATFTASPGSGIGGANDGAGTLTYYDTPGTWTQRATRSDSTYTTGYIGGFSFGGGRFDNFGGGTVSGGGDPQNATPAGRTSVSSFGSVTPTPGVVARSVSGRTSVSSFGTVGTQGGPASRSVPGHTSVSSFGTVAPAGGTISQNVPGHTSASSFGEVTARQVVRIDVTGHTSQSQYGTVTVTPGGAAASVDGHTSASQFGAVTTDAGAVSVNVPGHESASLFGDAEGVIEGAVLVPGHTSLSLFGVVTPAGGEAAVDVPGHTSVSRFGVVAPPQIVGLSLIRISESGGSKVRAVSEGGSKVRIVTQGGSKVRIVEEGGSSVQIVQ